MDFLKTLEVRRQIFHLLFGLFLIFLIYLDILDSYSILFIIVIGLIISLLSINYKIPLITYMLKRFDREKDIKKFPGKGVLTYMLGTLFALLLFDKNIAMASITILAVGDSFSHIIGRYFGKIKNPFSIKNIEGTMAAIILSTLATYFFVPLLLGFLGSLVAMVVESINESELIIFNDNIFIPIISGLVMALLI